MSQRKLILTMQMTLDGFVSGPKDEADWLIGDAEEWADMFDVLATADTYILGRKMYPLYSSYWQSVLKDPKSKPDELKFAKLAENTPHIVFTKGSFEPDWSNTRVAQDPKEEIVKIKNEPGKNIVAWGGAHFASNLINLGLVDEMRIELNPNAIVKGKALFANLDGQHKFELIDSKALKSGLVILRYKSL